MAAFKQSRTLREWDSTTCCQVVVLKHNQMPTALCASRSPTTNTDSLKTSSRVKLLFFKFLIMLGEDLVKKTNKE